MKIRTHHEMQQYAAFEDRYEYLRIPGAVGRATFGFDRYLNQKFYTSRQWKRVRDEVIVRDNGCDLGVPGYEIQDLILVHHMNPIRLEDLVAGNPDVLNPDFLVCTSKVTHLAIHYGDSKLLPALPVERKRGDTRLW